MTVATERARSGPVSVHAGMSPHGAMIRQLARQPGPARDGHAGPALRPARRSVATRPGIPRRVRTMRHGR